MESDPHSQSEAPNLRRYLSVTHHRSALAWCLVMVDVLYPPGVNSSHIFTSCQRYGVVFYLVFVFSLVISTCVVTTRPALCTSQCFNYTCQGRESEKLVTLILFFPCEIRSTEPYYKRILPLNKSTLASPRIIHDVI